MTKAILIAPVVAAMLATPMLADSAPHWTYEGAEGPTHWSEISKDFLSCQAGDQQSPIDLTSGVVAVPDMVALHWNEKADWAVVNNGHTIQASGKDAGYITIAGKRYDLLQFHFHHPSEHAVDGKRAPMEVHFVHKAEDGDLAVIGVLMVGGGHNTAFDAIMAAAPKSHGEAELGEVDFHSFLPETEHFYRYQGSLTTPPCSETVLWTVMQDPVAVSDEAIEDFGRMFEMNARPLQSAHRRFVLRG
jgi:carbonic anhydrase